MNPTAVHVGDCEATPRAGLCRSVTREQALDPLSQVPSCVHCRPGTALGTDQKRERPGRRAGRG
ncbi:DUF6233 domain-containing protein [Streptomyces olivaceoviridis]